MLPTLCSEPNPDVAVAFAQSAALAANITNPSGIAGSGNASFSSTETVTALAGRTAGVLALRDGLYAACQTYVNGVIGHDAYALILSQYGNLLVALNGTGTINQTTFTAQDAATSALLVSCLSEHDPTRLAAGRLEGTERTNPLLNTRFCTRLLDSVARGHPVVQTAPAKQKTAAKETIPALTLTPAPVDPTTTTVTAKKTSSVSGAGRPPK
ncbi:hypothetical protein [Bradyrhizobium brasilense]|uniref:Uncharacterized protein n=1 Tax=Bradyrhizobium brasilense TaxID=1419277 RepID=A0ABY8JAT0_9BRAD|nr:hypothetical protein [Bradyrhizobium brasilense]WFU62680.1 hypothetical protein QA636_35410 [Bradyrhizobium brasilense]